MFYSCHNQCHQSRREALSGPSNLFCLFDDIPLFWDAWDTMDYHLQTRRVQGGGNLEIVASGLSAFLSGYFGLFGFVFVFCQTDLHVGLPMHLKYPGPLQASVRLILPVGERSKLDQLISLDCDSDCLVFSTTVKCMPACRQPQSVAHASFFFFDSAIGTRTANFSKQNLPPVCARQKPPLASSTV